MEMITLKLEGNYKEKMSSIMHKSLLDGSIISQLIQLHNLHDEELDYN